MEQRIWTLLWLMLIVLPIATAETLIQYPTGSDSWDDTISTCGDSSYTVSVTDGDPGYTTTTTQVSLSVYIGGDNIDMELHSPDGTYIELCGDDTSWCSTGDLNINDDFHQFDGLRDPTYNLGDWYVRIREMSCSSGYAHIGSLLVTPNQEMNTSNTCDCPVSGDWIISDGSNCTLTTTCNLGSNKLKLNNGHLRINSGGKLITTGLYIANLITTGLYTISGGLFIR